MGRQNKHIRFQVAHKAAQMIVEEGISDYVFAKRKAARFFGLLDSDTLPSNDEIKEALRMHQSIFLTKDRASRIKELRLESLNLMKKLNIFNPYLIGNVAEGIAIKYPVINIQLRTDALKEIEYFLINEGIIYSIKDKKINRTEKKVFPILSFENNGILIELSINANINIKNNFNQYSIKELEKIMTESIN